MTGLFDLPASDWWDGQLRHGLSVMVAARDELVAAGNHAAAERANAFAIVIAEERDRRVALRRDVESAFAWAVDITDTLQVADGSTTGW